MEELIKEIEARIESHVMHSMIEEDPSYWLGKESEAIFMLEKLKQLQDESDKV